MINDQAQKLLVAQVAHELKAHQTYMGISLYFERESLRGWAKLFHEQAVEEAGHAEDHQLPDRPRGPLQPAQTGAP